MGGSPVLLFANRPLGISSAFDQKDVPPGSFALEMRDADSDPGGLLRKRRGNPRLGIFPDRGSVRVTANTDYVNQAGVTDPGLTAAFSLGFLVRLDSVAAAQTLFSVFDETDTEDHLVVGLDGSANVFASIRTAPATLTTATVTSLALSAATTYHVWVTWDGTAQLRVSIHALDGTIDEANVAVASVQAIVGTVRIRAGGPDDAATVGMTGLLSEIFFDAATYYVTSTTIQIAWRWYRAVSHHSFSGRAADRPIHLWRCDDGTGFSTLSDDGTGGQALGVTGSPTWESAEPGVRHCGSPEGLWHDDSALIALRLDTTTTAIAKGISAYSMTSGGVATLMGGMRASTRVPSVAYMKDRGLVCLGDVENGCVYDADPDGSGDPSLSLAGITPPVDAPDLSLVGSGVSIDFRPGANAALTANFDENDPDDEVKGITENTAVGVDLTGVPDPVAAMSANAGTTVVPKDAATITFIWEITTPLILQNTRALFGIGDTPGTPPADQGGFWNSPASGTAQGEYLWLNIRDGSIGMRARNAAGQVFKTGTKGDRVGSREITEAFYEGEWREVLEVIRGIPGRREVRLRDGRTVVVDQDKVRTRQLPATGSTWLGGNTLYTIKLEYTASDGTWRLYMNDELEFTLTPGFSTSAAQRWIPIIDFHQGGAFRIYEMHWGEGQRHGAYQFRYTWYDTARKLESRPSPNASVEAQLQDIDVAITEAVPHPGVDAVRIYRSQPDKSELKLEAQLALASLPYSVVQPDDFDLDVDDLGDIPIGIALDFETYRPPRARHVTRHGRRLVFSGLDTTDRQWYDDDDDSEPADMFTWSRIEQPEYNPRTLALDNYERVGGGEIVATISDTLRLFVFERRKTWRYDGDLASADRSFAPIDDKQGLVARHALAVLRKTVFVPTASTIGVVTSQGIQPRAGVFDGSHIARQWVGKDTGFSQTLDTDDADREGFLAVVYEDLNEVWFAVRTPGANENDRILIFDLETGTWRFYRIYTTAIGRYRDGGKQIVCYADGDAIFLVRGEQSAVESDGDASNGGANTIHFTPSADSVGNVITDTGASFRTGTDLRGVRILVLSGTGAGSTAVIVSSTSTTLTLDRNITVDGDGGADPSEIVIGAPDFFVQWPVAVAHNVDHIVDRLEVTLRAQDSASVLDSDLLYRMYEGDTEVTQDEDAAVQPSPGTIFMDDEDANNETHTQAARPFGRNPRLAVSLENRKGDSPVEIHDVTAYIRLPRFTTSAGVSGASTPA